MLQVDFSENATIASQNETQSAHWCHGQATLITVYAWIKGDENESFDHHLKLTWNFFAISHEKGVVDGLGGTVKRAVWRHVRSGQVHRTTAEEYC